MADDPKPSAEQLADEIEAAFQESEELRGALREAIRHATNARAVRTNQPVHPGAIIAALMTEAGAICAMWGASLRKRPDEIEEFFNGALRNVRHGFRLELQRMQRPGPGPVN